MREECIPTYGTILEMLRRGFVPDEIAYVLKQEFHLISPEATIRNVISEAKYMGGPLRELDYAIKNGKRTFVQYWEKHADRKKLSEYAKRKKRKKANEEKVLPVDAKPAVIKQKNGSD